FPFRVYTRKSARYGSKDDDGPRAAREAKGSRVGFPRNLGRGQQGSFEDRTSLPIFYGDTASPDGKPYRYAGFFERDGVRYLRQSVLFVRPNPQAEIDGFLSFHGIEHEVTRATIG